MVDYVFVPYQENSMPRAKNTVAAKLGSDADVNPSRAQNKSAFVRSLPRHMPAKLVVEKAKARGMTISVMYVYSIRRAARVSGERASRALPSRAGHSAALSSGRVEDLLKALASELGLSRAIAVLEGEQRKVRMVLG
jgi:hypothetical protein